MTVKDQITSAKGAVPADTVIKNGKIVDVFNRTVIEGEDVAVSGGMIIGIGRYEGRETVDAGGRFIVPGLIDAHVHIESSMMTPQNFSRTIVPRGVTTAVTDPHEIANVLGTKGISYMIEDGKKSAADLYTMLPSSVPSTPFETAGAALTSRDLAVFLEDHAVLGLAEVMDYPAVAEASDDMLRKITLARKAGKTVDGHASGLPETALNVYRTAGIETDHECTTADEARERIRRGFYVMLREGSVAKDVLALLPAVTEANSHRFLFCTDDKHPDDLLAEGSIDHNIRLAVASGLSPVTAIAMASLNTALCYGLKTKGAVAPGCEATFSLVEDLHDFRADEVYVKGVLTARNGKMIDAPSETAPLPSALTGTVRPGQVQAEDFTIEIGTEGNANIIGVQANSLITRHLVEKVNADASGRFIPCVEKDQLTMAVVERHGKTGGKGVGIVKGLGLKKGAVATTIAHDSHNIIAAGTNEGDIASAVKALADQEGGFVIVLDGSTIASVPLPLAGLMSLSPALELAEQLEGLHKAFGKVGTEGGFNPFLTLSFLALPVIPSLKLTDKGLFSTEKMAHIPVGTRLH
ncbi:adenine deaminase [Alteribacter natronophilus]|uniref:adenine deaminase n=1 Tax=Alteribacter natronophilus TaxID=2583810 RepID=UPI00110E8707|nr:adenine deaminase [Alteribacter natronophilus]TMW70627.1 adenine deaminase [Alteribacter natronophilus]